MANAQQQAPSGATVVEDEDEAFDPNASPSQRTVVRMSRGEKSILLRLFIKHDLASATGDRFKELCKSLCDIMRTHSSVRVSTKNKINPDTIATYRKNYASPLLKHINSRVPFLGDHQGKPVFDQNRRPQLNLEKIDRLDIHSPGTNTTRSQFQFLKRFFGLAQYF